MGDVSCDPEYGKVNELEFDAVDNGWALRNGLDAKGDEQWVDDLDTASYWLNKLSRKESMDVEEVDPLTTSQAKAGKAKAKAGSKAVIGKAKAKYAAKKIALKELQDKLKVYSKRQVLSSIIPGNAKANDNSGFRDSEFISEIN